MFYSNKGVLISILHYTKTLVTNNEFHLMQTKPHRHLKEQTKLVSSFLILLVSTKKIAVYVHVDYYSD